MQVNIFDFGKEVRKVILKSPVIQKKVGENKVCCMIDKNAIMAGIGDKDRAYPMVTYQRTDLRMSLNKDGITEMTYAFDVFVVSDNYREVVELADAVNDAMIAGFNAGDYTLEFVTSDENADEDTYWVAIAYNITWK